MAMLFYRFALFLHIVGAFGLIAAVTLEAIGLRGLRRATQGDEARMWLGISRRLVSRACERAGCRDSESFALVPVLVLVNLLAAGLRARTGLLPTRLRAGARVLTGRLVLARVPSAGLLRWGARRAR